MINQNKLLINEGALIENSLQYDNTLYLPQSSVAPEKDEIFKVYSSPLKLIKGKSQWHEESIK